ncbi:GIN domain-containing protein [Dysgonomonas massiliensis]|uniref:GIN domain-containing protein n=1 Tax=Dysgonomonas massiliensis TaxID=2040292 RepID=UPI000C75F757|nr:DUF2807 domain-containing protein [Dysgonomonas massiliensis]
MKLNKTILLITLSVLGIATAFAQVNEDRKISSFDKISISSGIHVKYVESSKLSLKVEAENQKILDAVETSINGKTLNIAVKKKTNIKTNKSITVYISSPSLSAITTSSGSKFTAEKVTAKKELSISTTSGSSCNIQSINAPEAVFIDISSGASSEIANLKTPTLNLSTSSGSSSKLTAVDIANDINISSSSGSSSKIEGKAKNVNIDATSGSSVNVRKLTHDTINIAKDKSASVSK